MCGGVGTLSGDSAALSAIFSALFTGASARLIWTGGAETAAAARTTSSAACDVATWEGDPR